MKKINSIHYGGKVLTIGGLLAIIFPCIFWLLSVILDNDAFLFARNLCFVLGSIIIIIFFLHLGIELRQDKKIANYYSTHRNIKIPRTDGAYECYSCGSLQVKEDDSYCKTCGVVFAQYEDKLPQEILDNKL